MHPADALHARVRAMIAGEPASFDELARALAIHQHDHHEGYARLCRARGVDPRHDPIGALPAVPTDAFRVARVATFPAELDAAVFRTSGTTHGTRGAHAMRTLDTYRAASMSFARETLLHGLAAKPTILALSPVLPDSSLVQMMAWLIEQEGDHASRFVDPTDLGTATEAIAKTSRTVVLLATAFALVHLLDHLEGRALPLPRGSRVMLTGGFKGKSREIGEGELRRTSARTFAIAPRDVVGEYGMTELTSQLWAIPTDDETSLRYRSPRWVRVVACDPLELTPRPSGERGIARIEDLGNVESAWAVQTSDEVIVHEDGSVTLLGRAPGAVPRGCSIAIDELLGGRA